MTYEESLKMSPDELAKTAELFIIDRLQSYMEPDGKGGMKWVEPCRLRLIEIEDYKQRVREVIIRVFAPNPYYDMELSPKDHPVREEKWFKDIEKVFKEVGL